ncbi:unnamed protein product, partial [Prunus brigantina]
SSPTLLDPERVSPAAYAWSKYLFQNTYTRLIQRVTNENFELNILISQVSSKCTRKERF